MKIFFYLNIIIFILVKIAFKLHALFFVESSLDEIFAVSVFYLIKFVLAFAERVFIFGISNPSAVVALLLVPFLNDAEIVHNSELTLQNIGLGVGVMPH